MDSWCARSLSPPLSPRPLPRLSPPKGLALNLSQNAVSCEGILNGSVKQSQAVLPALHLPPLPLSEGCPSL